MFEVKRSNRKGTRLLSVEMKMVKLTILLALTFTTSMAQTIRPRYDKMSPMLRRIAHQEAANSRFRQPSDHHYKSSSVCAFVKVDDGGNEALIEHGCQVLTQVGDICIANIPKNRIASLSLDSRILLMEANRGSHTTTDSLAWFINALPIYAGKNLPQAYTGQGVVVGVMDIGFDLTHPNFYSRDTTQYRISRFWDMLSQDTIGSKLYVGRDFSGREELLQVAHARDAINLSHGTHTLGIAAGSGYTSPYVGMAPESDICLVANAVSDDIALIDSADYDKYTFATDALGFKYIFDYAEERGLPCVINFSEGSRQDFWGYDQLYYEMLARLTGPGRIIVAAAGNYGNDKNYLRKEKGRYKAGTFFRSWSKTALFTFKSDSNFSVRLVVYKNKSENDTLTINTVDVLAQQDSIIEGKLAELHEAQLNICAEAYPSSYHASETCFDVMMTGNANNLGSTYPISFEVIGSDADVEVYTGEGIMVDNMQLNSSLTDGEKSHSILSPGSSPNVICVGSTFYRPGAINYKGEHMMWQESGPWGEWCRHSSVGPTFDGRIKPDVVAPGCYIISSYNSFYLENHPNGSDTNWDIEHFEFNGRTYAWNIQYGTSMAAPAVAGSIALWMQAKPDLTTEEVLDVFKHTCSHYDPSLVYPNNRYGYGQIDAYRGLLYLLGADKIKGISVSQSKASVKYSDGCLVVDFGDVCSVASTLSIYNLSGKCLSTTTLPAGQSVYQLQIPSLPSATYVLQFNQIDGPGSSALIIVK